MTRLTGFSKNTCNSVNSLEYSPSPKKEEKPITGFSTTPINISNQEEATNPTQEELNMIRNIHQHGPNYPTSGRIQMVGDKNQAYEFSPQVLVCADVTAMNLSFHETPHEQTF